MSEQPPPKMSSNDLLKAANEQLVDLRHKSDQQNKLLVSISHSLTWVSLWLGLLFSLTLIGGCLSLLSNYSHGSP